MGNKDKWTDFLKEASPQEMFRKMGELLKAKDIEPKQAKVLWDKWREYRELEEDKAVKMALDPNFWIS